MTSHFHGLPVLTRRDIESLYPSMRDMSEFIESKRDPDKHMAEKEINPFLKGLEVAAGAAGVGFLGGRLGTLGIGTSRIPLGLALGGAGYAISMFGLAGPKYSPHLMNVSNGAIAGWLALYALAQGREMACKADPQKCGPVIAGYQPAMIGAYNPPMLQSAPTQFGYPKPLTEAELQVMAQAA